MKNQATLKINGTDYLLTLKLEYGMERNEINLGDISVEDLKDAVKINLAYTLETKDGSDSMTFELKDEDGEAWYYQETEFENYVEIKKSDLEIKAHYLSEKDIKIKNFEISSIEGHWYSCSDDDWFVKEMTNLFESSLEDMEAFITLKKVA